MCDGWSTGSRREAGRIIQSINCLNRSSNSVFCFQIVWKELNSASCKNAGKISELFGICQSNRRPGSMSPRGPRLTQQSNGRHTACTEPSINCQARGRRLIVLVISSSEGYWLLLLETGTFMRREWGRPDVWTLVHGYSEKRFFHNTFFYNCTTCQTLLLCLYIYNQNM